MLKKAEQRYDFNKDSIEKNLYSNTAISIWVNSMVNYRPHFSGSIIWSNFKNKIISDMSNFKHFKGGNFCKHTEILPSF